ncbi:hypothetical protein HYPSUDRAFT_1082968 [Hypholoma sublateritium FD-334 SS-4]|uniref:PD-(D/E)XK endonuclease-like domain-containing protein n=1 Tax=Hypholoma sublateritium (strain FD-334 SS-4) TaxID=945553 RepID=A0A0D2QB39_HYPSF|nr:hypothetical protein HYPSUDRAFT_1082968 [Hypholoma sublateritium FD-334 SS-4]
MSSKKSLTATNLAVHQHLNCDLYIHNVYNRTAPASGQDPASENTSDELSKAQFKRGLDWEASLYAWLDDSGLLLQVPAIPLAASILLENILADDRTHFFITGLSFWPPQSKLNERFVQAGAEPLTFGLAKPDLVEIKRTNNIIQWRVIDAKASKNVKTSHHIQIYFYTLCLSYLLEPPFFQIAGTSGIWLPPKDGFQTSSPSVADIKTVSVSLLAPALDALLFRELPKIISLPVAKVKWHYNPLCHGCQYERTCRARAEDEGQLGRMPNLSIDDAQILKDLLRISRSAGFQSTGVKLTDIEELHHLLANPAKVDQVAKASPTLFKKGKRILSLPKKVYQRNAALQSPLVEAARTQEIQIMRQRNYTCPSKEDIAIVLSIVNDPASSNPGGDFFCATLHSEDSEIILPAPFTCSADEFVSKLATIIRSIATLHPDNSRRYSSQFYVWAAAEQTLLQAHIINAALHPGTSNADIRLCISALAQGVSLLQTTFQPILLSGALINFLGKGKKLKSEYQACLARLGLSTDGTVDVLRKRIDEGIRKIRDEMASASGHDYRRREFSQLPPVVSLMKEVQRQMAFPIPGYWNLPECVELLLRSENACPSDEQIFAMYKAGYDSEAFSNVLLGRNLLIYSVLKEFRKRVVSTTNHSLFINEARIMSTNFMDICKESHIRKLFFMQQFEVLAKLTDLWKSRIDGCPEAPTLEYSNVVQGRNGPEYVFRLVCGTVDVPAFDRDWAFYDKLLVLDSSEVTNNGTDPDSLPVEALFDDLGISGLVFPLNRWTKASWGQQHPRVQRELVVADVRNVYTDKNAASTMVALRIWGNWQMSLTPGSIFRLSPRLVDFNTSKILSALFEIDVLWESEGSLYADEEDDGHHSVPFLQLVMNPNSFGKIHGAKKYVKTEGEIQKLFRDLKGLENNIAGSLVLKSSQHRATQRILSNRLSVVWGPPGTGKTYTISLSLLRLIEVEGRYSGPRRRIIFITAITHAAIEACRSKLVRLMDAYRSVESLPHKWLDEVKVEVVSRGNDHPGPSRSDNGTYIYAGTLFQLSNFTKRHSFQVDCVIADEAGQISLGAISLVLRSLTVEGRIIFAGDSEQLAPILSAQYPQLKFSSLFGSVLDCLMFSSNPISRENSQVLQASQDEGSEFQASQSQNTVVQLTENFRYVIILLEETDS